MQQTEINIPSPKAFIPKAFWILISFRLSFYTANIYNWITIKLEPKVVVTTTAIPWFQSLVVYSLQTLVSKESMEYNTK